MLSQPADSAELPPIGAVVVAFLGDGDEAGRVALGRCLAAVAAQVSEVLVIDNSPTSQEPLLSASAERGSPRGPSIARISWRHQSSNRGVATAYNLALAWAHSRGYEWLLLLDQDSVVDPACVATLGRVLQADPGVLAAGPVQVDHGSGSRAPFVQVRFPVSRKLHDYSGPVDFLISSGTLLRVEPVRAAEGFRDELFVDNVDLEWSFRMRAQGWRLHGVNQATMRHSIGPQARRLPGGYRVALHPPLRLYFIMRNRLLLYRFKATPPRWIAQDFLRVWVKLLLFGVIFQPRRENLVMMLWGLLDGARGRGGPAPSRLVRRVRS